MDPLLAKEAVAVGGLFLIIYVIIHVIYMAFSNSFAMSHAGIFIAAFITGAAGHLLLEYTGMNKKYCDEKNKLV
jgi:hypothetical protein